MVSFMLFMQNEERLNVCEEKCKAYSGSKEAMKDVIGRNLVS